MEQSVNRLHYRVETRDNIPLFMYPIKPNRIDWNFKFIIVKKTKKIVSIQPDENGSISINKLLDFITLTQFDFINSPLFDFINSTVVNYFTGFRSRDTGHPEGG